MLNIGKIIGKFVKNSSQKEIDRLKSVVKKINDLEPQVKKLSDNDLIGFPYQIIIGTNNLKKNLVEIKTRKNINKFY